MVQSDAPNAPSYRGMLALVIILGALIVAGVIGLIVGAVYRLGSRAVVAAGPYAATIPAPGERIENMEMAGNRILLHLSGPKGEELAILDAGTGRVLGRIAVDAKQ